MSETESAPLPLVSYLSAYNLIFCSINGVDMCLNIYDVRLDDTSPACGMNWPPDMAPITSFLGVRFLQSFHVCLVSKSII